MKDLSLQSMRSSVALIEQMLLTPDCQLHDRSSQTKVEELTSTDKASSLLVQVPSQAAAQCLSLWSPGKQPDTQVYTL